MKNLLQKISEAYQSDKRQEELRKKYLDIFNEFIEKLENGELRAAEKNNNGEWEANPKVKQGILLGFKLGKNKVFENGYMQFKDKDTLPPQESFEKTRIVPGGSSVRAGAYVGDIIQMPPSYINVGAYVDDGSMVDSEALVGSAAQVGKNVHLSAGAKLGGVLEPVNQSPVIIEDNCTIGANSGIFEGVIVRENAVIASGLNITSSTEIYDKEKNKVYTGEIPRNAVVIPGTVEYGELNGKKLNKDIAIIPKYRDKSTDAETALEEALR